MNRAQRLWTAGALVLIGLLIAPTAIEWDIRPSINQGTSIFTFSYNPPSDPKEHRDHEASARSKMDTAAAPQRPPIECASAKNAKECADILERAGKNPFDAYGFVGQEPVYGNQSALTAVSDPCLIAILQEMARTGVEQIGTSSCDMGFFIKRQWRPVLSFGAG